jgi:hypothetical protein
MIKPTVGRIVLFHPSTYDDLHRQLETYTPAGETAQPMAAIVTYVWSDTMVNLHVFDYAGNGYPVTSVQLVQPGDAAPGDNAYCYWMAYQLGQAAKYEELQAQQNAQKKAGGINEKASSG